MLSVFKPVILLFSLLCTTTIFSEVPGQNIDYSKAKKDVISATEKINTFGAMTAAQLIINNIEKVDELKISIFEAKHVDDVIDDVANSLYEISKTYNKVTEQKDAILEIHKNSLKTISNADEAIISISIDNNNRSILAHQKEIDSLLKSLETETNKISRRKLEININSKKSVINSLKSKNQVWNNFRIAQEKLLTRLQNNSDIIDLFLFTLDKNADVYKEAADVTMLRKNSKSMLTQLTLLNSVDDVIKDIENNWLEINDLMDQISSSEFKIE